jgi:lipopolysaccharide transport system ATP-binding protein
VSDTVICVENLSKQYILSHQQTARYQTLKDSIAHSLMAWGRFFRPTHPLAKKAIQQEEFWALKDVSFEIRQGDRVGIVGRNGAGKSTLLKILSRITEPTAGRIAIRGRVASLLEVGTGFHPELSGRENIFLNGAILGMGRSEIRKNFDEIVAFAEVERFLDTPVKRYSSGMYVRLAFAVAAHLEPEILIVDEVLAVGDLAFQRKCLGKIENIGQQGRTVLFVSHNMATIRRLCTKAIMLEQGTLHSQGSVHDVIENYKQTIFSLSQDQKEEGVLYAVSHPPKNIDFWIRRIEVFDENWHLKNTIATWDYVRFRIHYTALRQIKRASGVLSILNEEHVRLLLCSTMPDQKIPMEIHVGEHYFDCVFPCWPLAAGKYFLNAGLAVPMREWLCQTNELITFSTTIKDVFDSGVPPESSRYLVVTPYEMYPEELENKLEPNNYLA